MMSVLRLVYILHRFYFDTENHKFLSEFQVNMSRYHALLSFNCRGLFPSSSRTSTHSFLSTVEIDVAIICSCLPTIKPFLRRFAPSIFKLSSFSHAEPYSQSGKRTTGMPSIIQPSHKKVDRTRPTDSCDEELAGAAYHELDEDGKSNQSYAMTTVRVQPQRSSIAD